MVGRRRPRRCQVWGIGERVVAARGWGWPQVSEGSRLRDLEPGIALGRPLMPDAVTQLRALNLAGERFREAVGDRFGLGSLELVALGWIGAAGPLRVPSIAEAMAVTVPTLTPLLDRLEGAELVDRTDGQDTEFAVTDPGARILDQARAWMASALDVFDDDHLVQAVHVLTELRLALDHRAAEIKRGA